MGWRSCAAALVLAARVAAADEEARSEPALLPAVSYSSDTGLGVGLIGSLARIEPGVLPYRYRVEALLSLSLKDAPDGGLEAVSHNDYVVVEVPGLAGGRLRLRGGLSFDRVINSGYYGVGNASVAQAGGTPRHEQYESLQLRVEPGLRLRLRQALELLLAVRAGYTGVGIYPGSKLEADRAGLDGTLDHGELGATAGVIWDSRDHEAWPRRGILADASLRAGAGLGEAFAYGGGTLAGRAFLNLFGDVTLGFRLVADALWGTPPFDELVRVGGLGAGGATGGGTSLRGVPGGRYRGKLKLLGGLELRPRAPELRIGSQRFHLGLVAFVDAGRVWAPDEDLDGEGLGLTLGVGGGLRVQWGETFIVRADLGYGPREETTGLYIDVGQVF